MTNPSPLWVGAARSAEGCKESHPRSDLVLVHETKLLENEHVTSVGEGGEAYRRIGNVVVGVGEVGVDAAEEIEDQLGFLHAMSDVTKRVNHLLHLLAVFQGGGITLGDVVELVVEEDRSRFLVGVEEVFRLRARVHGTMQNLSLVPVGNWH